jgi:conjugal transfer mating pair stabilization protein TraG
VAIPTLTIYSVSADLTTLSAVLNGVAMICKQDTLIWGFALMVAMWRLLVTSTSAVLRSPTGQGGAVLGSGPLNTLMPFILAMLLTNPMLQGTVQVEATINGAVTEVDHVPLAISAIPAAGSVLSMNLNEVVSTAFGNVDDEYPTISATANGFLNPLKMLLTSRTALYRLNGLDSEVKTVLSSCLGPDSGVNYANIENLVLNAGNTGATAATSISINGLNPTAMGALLYQASLNTTALVNDAALSQTQELNCSDAANQVANDITNAINSVEFTRVIQGAVNGMDQPIPGADYSFNTIAAQYDAVSRANTLGSVFTGGTGQSNAEFMNLLFSEMVESDLNCLKASSDTLVECQATALQASEVERNNLSMAASEVPMLRYAGSFGNYLIALIIGLGPVIVMFMMFAGVEAGKCVKTVAHLTVWPLLVVNVGAELVNGMICIDVANYLTSLRQGGWLSQAASLAAYQELSMQIGVGSHIMASLPVLMSMIFGLGESSALTSVATSIAPKSRDVADNTAVTPEVSRPMFENSSIGKADQFAHGAGNLQLTGGTNAVSTSMSFGSMAREASNTLTQSDTRSQSISAGRTNLAEWREAMSSGNYTRLGLDQSVGESVADEFRRGQRAATNAHANTSVTGTRMNTNESHAGVQGSIGAGAGAGDGDDEGGGEGGGGGWGFHASAGASGGTSTKATDVLTGSDSRGRSKDYTDSVDLAKALSKTMSKFENSSAGRQASSELARSLSTQENYQQSLSDVKSSANAAAQGVRDTSSFVEASSQIGTNEIVWQNKANSEYAAFQLLSGRKFDENAANRPYLAQAATDAASGATGRVEHDSEGQQAVNRHRAAVMLAQDPTAKPEDRLAATRYLTEEANAMQHMRFEPTNTVPMQMDIAAPVDSTGVNSGALRAAAGSRTPVAPVPAVPTARGPASGLAPASTPTQALPQALAPAPGAPVADGSRAPAAAAPTAPAVPAHGRNADPASTPSQALPQAPYHGVPATDGSRASAAATQTAPAVPAHGRNADPASTPSQALPQAPMHGVPATDGSRASAAAAQTAPAVPAHGRNADPASTPSQALPQAPIHGVPATDGSRASAAAAQSAPAVPAHERNASLANHAANGHGGEAPARGAGPRATQAPAVPAEQRASAPAPHADAGSAAAATAPMPRPAAGQPARRGPRAEAGHPAVRPEHAGAEPKQPAGASPQSAAPNRPGFNLAPDLEKEVTGRMNAIHDGVEKSVSGAEKLGHNAGLDAQGHGTVVRIAANVADNVVDVGRAAGSSSRTRLGNTDEPAPAPEKHEAANKSHFVRRGPG